MENTFEEVKLHLMRMGLKNPFTTSFGTFKDKDFMVTELIDNDGNRGFGESVAFPIPWYNEETLQTNIHIIKDFLIPIIKQNTIEHPNRVNELFKPIKRNNMAKSAIEGSIWDLYAKQNGMSL